MLWKIEKGKRGGHILKKTIRVVALIVVLVSVLSPYALTQLAAKYRAAQRKELENPWVVDGNLTLRWDIFPEPVVVFENCSGFIINCSDAVLDLNDHTVMFESGGKAPGEDGVVVQGRHGVTIKNGDITGFQIGIYVRDSIGVNIINNTVSEMANIGISIEHMTKPTSNITIANNTVFAIEKQGIWLDSLDHVDISHNVVSSCYSDGIMMHDSTNCTVIGNTLSNNDPCGLYMDISIGNIISDNTLLGNIIGLQSDESTSNVICHNNFVDNADQVVTIGSTNTWNYSYPCGGNYWSSYEGEDRFSGRNQNVLGSDGIGDQPHVIDENNRDMHPLVDRWGTTLKVFDIAWNMSQAGARWKTVCSVALFSDSSVTDFDFNKTLKRISFDTSNGTFCRVIVAKDILEGAFNCSVDDVIRDSNLNWDETHTFMGFAYNNESHRVEITGERALRIVGDLDNNGVVNMRDIGQAARNFMTETG
jgi:parallel beta-helix repeat protein